MCAIYQLEMEDVEEIRRIAREITEKYGEEAADRAFHSDFYPKSFAPVVGKRNQVLLLRWGIPLAGTAKPVFNTRSEGLAEKRFYRGMLGNRCLVPATAFYEWGSDRKKYRFRLPQAPFFYMAGLWRALRRPGEPADYRFTLLTTAPTRTVARIHPRMPAIVLPQDGRAWLDGARQPEPLDAEMQVLEA